MLPNDLKPEQFSGYPPEARKLVVDHLAVLQRVPLSLLPSMLRELIDYDYKFPAERRARESELTYLSSLSDAQWKECFREFSAIRLSPQLEAFYWVKFPAQYVEQLSAHLWSTHQLDAFRKASNDYNDRLHAASPPQPPSIPRLGIAVIGQSITSYDAPLFRKLRPHGALFAAVNPENGLRQLLDAVAARAKAHPEPYAHWYIEGGDEETHAAELTCVSYQTLEPARSALLAKIASETDRPGMGPETLRTVMAGLRPADLGMDLLTNDRRKDEVLERFQVSVLTEGSGTQIFSTVFAQWASREALRRAQPVTLLVRFAPRQRQKPMSELLSASKAHPELDPLGSLIDADMGAYYNWLNLQRLAGADQSAFLAWFEGHNQALAIGPSLPRGTESNASIDLGKLLASMT